MSSVPGLSLNQFRSDLVKDRLQIVVFGAYRPDGPRDRLIVFKQFLQNNGYTGTRIVADMDQPLRITGQTEAEYFWMKCQFWMDHADVVLFTFFNDGRIEGVTSEFSHYVDNLKNRIWRAVVFTEPDDLSMMIQGRLDLWKIELKQTTFSGDTDLHEFALGYLIDYPKKLYYDIKDRTPFLAV